MTCNCNYRAKESPEEIVSKVRKGTVKFCDVCDPCNECVTNVKICAFVVPTLEEGRYFKNSFIFVQEDDSVYFISDDRSEIPFGSRPKFIDDFDPTATDIHYKSTVVYDVKNGAGYIYDPEGKMVTFSLTTNPFSSITEGDGIVVTATGGDYTIAIDPTAVASEEDLHNVTLLVTNHTNQIGALQKADTEMAGDISDLGTELTHVHDLADDANGLAVEAKENAAAAQQTANDAVSAVNAKQDALTAGENISIVNNVISAAVPAYGKATTSQNGLMSVEDRKVMKNSGIYVPAANTTTSATTVTINYTKSVSDDDGTAYTVTNETTTIPAATTQVAGVMAAADKSKLDGIASGAEVNVQSDWNQTTATADDFIKNKPIVAQFTLTDTDPGTGGTLAANNFIAVYEV